jgi:hypothetical protein
MLNLLNTLILVGSLQGFIVGALFLLPASHPLPKRLMGALLFLIALASLNVFLNEQVWYRSSVFCQMLDALFPFILPMAFGPLLYFYVQATLEPGFALKRPWNSPYKKGR